MKKNIGRKWTAELTTYPDAGGKIKLKAYPSASGHFDVTAYFMFEANAVEVYEALRTREDILPLLSKMI